LIPRADPFAAKEGSSLPVEVRFDGAVLKDHIVEVGDETAASKGPELRTDSRGIVIVKLDHKGFYRMRSITVPPRNILICFPLTTTRLAGVQPMTLG